jgi:hypothetical protein
MLKRMHSLLLMMALMALAGCQTINGASTGAANGFSQDMHNLSDPDQNGWNSLERVDAWIQRNLW